MKGITEGGQSRRAIVMSIHPSVIIRAGGEGFKNKKKVFSGCTK